MFSKTNSRKKDGDNSEAGKFTYELETISKALYIDKTLPRLVTSTSDSRSMSVGKSHSPDSKTKHKDLKDKDSSDKEKKSSIWSWKGLKSLTNTRNRRLNCCFSLIVHSVEGLPPIFDDVCLVVHWKRRDSKQMTRPVRVYQGVAEIDEQLTHSCSVNGTRSGVNHSAKYEAKHFLLYVSIYNAPELDLGKHRVDMTRLLPLTFEELEEEKSFGKWTTSFRLSGKARGATMNVSFGYAVIANNSSNKSVTESPRLSQDSENIVKLIGQFDLKDELNVIRRVESLPAKLSMLNQPSEDIKDLHEVLPVLGPEFSESVNVLYQKLEEEISEASVENKLEFSHVHTRKPDSFTQSDAGEKISESEWEISEFSVVEKGIEEFTNEQVKLENNISEVLEIVEVPVSNHAAINPSQETETVGQKDEQSVSTCNFEEKENDLCSKESLMDELETALTYATDLVNEGLDSEEDETDATHREQEDSLYIMNSCYNIDHMRTESLSFDDLTNSVANEFLDMLGIEHSPVCSSSESEPESPRERLLQQFEKDALSNGGLLDLDIENDSTDLLWESISNNRHRLSPTHEAFQESPNLEKSASRIKTRASRFEDLESESLMGLNEEEVEHSPPPSTSGEFGDHVDVPLNEVHRRPPVAEGLGPFVRSKNGGFLRSMDPALLTSAKNGGSLIMQVSSPVVVPAEMGSGVMDILEGLAALGIEKLSMQANRLMPLEDITGKSIRQLAWAAGLSLEGIKRQDLLQPESEMLQNEDISYSPGSSASTSFCIDSEYVSLEDLAPLAMDKIEALSIEGLRIQSGMLNEDALSNLTAQSIGEFSVLDTGGSIGLDGTGGIRLLDVKDNGEDIDGLMGLSLTLDEWLRLDAGDIDDDDLVNERTSKILAAHQASSLDAFRGRSMGEKRAGKYGWLGNNFTVALMVQLRDPLRDYEPVGTRMLSLIQVERVFVPQKLKIYRMVRPAGNIDEEEEDEEPKEDKIIHKEEVIPQYKIMDVHVAGLKVESGKKKLWGSANQQKAGSRWLLVNGMGKKNKHPLMKSKPVVKSSCSVQPGDTLWSISCRVHGTGDKWKDLATLNPHIRNPNALISNETIRLR